MASDDLDKVISDLENDIDARTSFDDHVLPEYLAELRNRVLHVHATVEYQLELIITNKLILLGNNNLDQSEKMYSTFSQFLGVMSEFLDGMTFSQKLERVRKLNAISEDIYKAIKEMNVIRNNFAHLKSQKYKQYESKIGYSKALESTRNAIVGAIEAEDQLFKQITSSQKDK